VLFLDGFTVRSIELATHLASLSCVPRIRWDVEQSGSHHVVRKSVLGGCTAKSGSGKTPAHRDLNASGSSPSNYLRHYIVSSHVIGPVVAHNTDPVGHGIFDQINLDFPVISQRQS
jgi:hypothetical protein